MVADTKELKTLYLNVINSVTSPMPLSTIINSAVSREISKMCLCN